MPVSPSDIADTLLHLRCPIEDEDVLSYIASLLNDADVDDDTLQAVLTSHVQPEERAVAVIAALRQLQRSTSRAAPSTLKSTNVAASSKPATKKQQPSTKRGRTKFTALDVAVGTSTPREGILSSVDSDRVCRFYLAGSCNRSDCPFSHDVSHTPCAFFHTPTGCTSGAACKFLHDTTATAANNTDCRGDTMTDDDLLQLLLQLDEDLLDTLRAMNVEQDVDDAPLEVTETSFPALASASISRCAAPADRATSTPQALTPSARDLYQSLFHFGPRAPLATSGPGAHGAVSAAHRGTSGGRAHAGTAQQIARALPRLDTGAAVAAVYARARGDAEAMARARNSAFDKAARAFASGDRAAAISLARQAQQLDDRMRTQHGVAADAIFAELNHGLPRCEAARLLHAYAYTITLASGERIPSVAIVDLHGLHPSECALVIDSVCSAELSDPAWVALMCGTRSHSQAYGKGGGSISDEVLAQLVDSGVEHYTPAVVGGSGVTDGVIMLRLQPAS